MRYNQRRNAFTLVEDFAKGKRNVWFRPIWLMMLRKQGSTSTTMHSDWKPLKNRDVSDEVNWKPFRKHGVRLGPPNANTPPPLLPNIRSNPPSSFLSLFHFNLPQGFLSDSIKTHSPCLRKTDFLPCEAFYWFRPYFPVFLFGKYSLQRSLTDRVADGKAGAAYRFCQMRSSANTVNNSHRLLKAAIRSKKDWLFLGHSCTKVQLDHHPLIMKLKTQYLSK